MKNESTRKRFIETTGQETLTTILRGDVLVNVAGVLAQIEHHAVLHRFVKFVGVDVAAKDDDAALAALHASLRGAHAKILIVPAEFFGPGVKDNEVVNEF